MRKSIVLEKLRRGETVFCLKSLYADPDLCELLGRLGSEVIWICNEHIAIDPSRLREVIRAGRAGNVDIMIRRAFGNYDDLIQPLEMGAAGLMIPHCRDAAMARAIVREVRFHPLGNRGIDGISADSGFGLHPLAEYIKFANRETFLMLQIEDVEAIDEIEAIAAVEGVDIIFIGPADLSQSLGVPGEVKHPRIRETIERAVKACRKHGKWCGTAGIDLGYTRELIASGVNFVTLTSDYRILREGVKNTLSEYNRLLN
ncbi:MAG: HpcH/HpaI aldolase/citrate lyase family protein [Victivallaceae bacterium]